MTDVISRQRAIDALRDYLVEKRCPDDGTLTCRLIENEVINKLPPAEPKTSEGPVIRKMVPLDDLKRCADLCIDIGWTLQEFRKNMDEWDEDTIEITETE